MALYSYSCDACGWTTEVLGTFDNHPESVVCASCGKQATRDIGRDLQKRPKLSEIWPMASDAASVHSSQIAQFREFDKSHGVPTDYLPDGRPVWRSRGHKRDYCKIHHLFDKDGGYGDAQHDACPQQVSPQDFDF